MADLGGLMAGDHAFEVPTADIARSVADWSRMWDRLPRWRGSDCQQFPADLWRYAELCFELRPPWVLEIGVAAGGTALFLADVLGAAGGGRVIAVDPRPVALDHPRVTVLTGDAADPAVIGAVTGMSDGGRGIVLLDGDHAAAQVAAELDAYSGIAGYLVAEDTLMRWLPAFRHASGPLDALDAWLPQHPEFAADPDPVPTNHPGGWLRRTAG